MSSSSTPQPDSSGSFSRENAPWVVVRAEKTFLCTACGTMVEVPADVVGQLVLAIEQPTPEKPVQETPAAKEPDVTQAPPKAPARPQRSQRPKRARFTGEMIDGLRVPSAAELDRGLAWVSFHLNVLDRQGSECNRLQKLLKNRAEQPAPQVSQQGHARKADAPLPVGRVGHEMQEHACDESGVTPGKGPHLNRGPP